MGLLILEKRETMTTENRDLTQVSLVFAHTSTHKDQRLSLPFFRGKSGLITHNQNLYVNKKMGKNLFLYSYTVKYCDVFSPERDFQDCDCADVEPILYIFFLVKAFSKHRETRVTHIAI